MTRASSEDLFAKAQSLMPGGVSSPVRAFGAVGGTPRFIASGSGSRVEDVDGNSYIDMLGSWGPLILGHAHPEVVEAVVQAASGGTSFGAPTSREIELAELIVAAIPSVEMVRFVSSGTEAAMSALRLARAATRRDKIVKFAGGYHGHADSLLVGSGSGAVTLGLPDSPGVSKGMREGTVVVPFNSPSALEQAFQHFGSEIAAVIIEPVAANMGVVPPLPGFLEEVRRIASDNGSILIFDEVVTGFRVGLSGAQGLYGVEPDLTVLGKVIGGGLPVGAYGGRRDLMEMVAPSGPVYQAGTLSGNPVAIAAGIATLSHLVRQPDVYPELDALGELLQQGLEAAAKEHSVAVEVQRIGSMLTAFFCEGAVRDLDSAKRSDTELFATYFHSLLEAGVYWPPSQFEAAFISTAHDRTDIEAVVTAAGQAMSQIRGRGR